MPPSDTPDQAQTTAIPSGTPGRVPNDDLEIELDPHAPPASEEHTHTPAPAQSASAPASTETVRPWHADQNYKTLCEMRDEMRLLAKTSARLAPKDRVAAARAAISAADHLIDWFGVETGESESAAEQAAIRAGTEAARRAVNTGMFGAASPHSPAAWATAPGDPKPHRESDGHPDEDGSDT